MRAHIRWYQAMSLVLALVLSVGIVYAADSTNELKTQLEKANSQVKSLEARRIISWQQIAYLNIQLKTAQEGLVIEAGRVSELDKSLSEKEESLQEFRKELVAAANDNLSLLEENASVVKLGRALLEQNDFLRRAVVVSRIDCNGCGKVAITIDDGGSKGMTELALRVLRKKGVNATLFPMGLALARYPKLYRRAVEDGDELGNHTLSHSDRKSTRLNSSHIPLSRMPSSA